MSTCLSAATNLLKEGLTYFLRQSGVDSDCRQMPLEAWLKELSCLGSSLGSAKISRAEWVRETERLYGAVRLEDLRAWIDIHRPFEQLTNLDLGARGELFETLFVAEPQEATLPVDEESARLLVAKLAHVKKGRSIPPHGHKNMVSAFLVVSGEFHVRQYDKLEDAGDSLVVRVSLDEKQRAGCWSAISDERNNVHWLKAMSDDCFLFTTKLCRLREDMEYFGRINIDVNAATTYGTILKAPKITFAEAMERY